MLFKEGLPHQGKLSILPVNRIEGDTVRITLVDELSGKQVTCIELSLFQWANATIGRQSRIYCEYRLDNLEKAGKKKRVETIDCPLPEGTSWDNLKDVAPKAAQAAAPDGWLVEDSFNRKDSFSWSNEHDRWFCRARICKYEEV